MKVQNYLHETSFLKTNSLTQKLIFFKTTLYYKVLTWVFIFIFNVDGFKFSKLFYQFLMSELKDILSQPSDSNQLIVDLTYSNLNVHSAKKSQRSKNFSLKEDCLLVSAWLNTSKDPITGVEQQTKQFWARVHAYFVENGGNLNNCSQISISSKWQEINREVGKFVGFVTQIENHQQSGMTEESRVILIFIFILNCLTHILTLFNFSNFFY